MRGRGAPREGLQEELDPVGPRFAVLRRGASAPGRGPRRSRIEAIVRGVVLPGALFLSVSLFSVPFSWARPLWGCTSEAVPPRTDPEIAQESVPESAGDRAAESDAPVVLRWSTATEFERHGYHVFRGADPDGPFERLTDESIPGAGTTDLPQHYRFEDRTARPGSVYFYFVESVSTSGERERFTPVRPFVAGIGETSS